MEIIFSNTPPLSAASPRPARANASFPFSSAPRQFRVGDGFVAAAAGRMSEEILKKLAGCDFHITELSCAVHALFMQVSFHEASVF
jgi:hypothetical protein